MSYPLSQHGVEARATLLDKRKVKSRRVGDGLEMVSWAKVGIGSGNCRKLTLTQTGYCLRKREIGIEIGVVCAAAITRPPTGVNRKLHQVCEASYLLSPCR